MKILLLDIDGVLNCQDYLALVADQEGSVEAYDIDPARVQLLNEILRRTGAKVVITSAWRDPDNPSLVPRLLRTRGFEGDVVGQTPYLSRNPDGTPAYRGHEILAWLAEQTQKPDQYVILDDGWPFPYGDPAVPELHRHLVKTSMTAGLQREHVEMAVARLGPV